jgi:hypothetical protein
MQDNRFVPASHSAKASENDVGAASKGVASESSELRDGGPHGTASAGPEGVIPVGPQMDAAVGAEPQAKSAAPTPRNAVPASEPVTKTFPESWREDLAGGDKAFRKTLDRFESPTALAKAYKELTARLSSGDLKATKPPPDNATPEQIAAWRAEQGLPQSAAAYVDGLQLGDGTVMGKAETALLASFADQAMKGRWTADQYNQAVGWYLDAQDQLAAQRNHADAAFKHEASAGLMREWGHDYATNRNAIAQFFDRSFPRDFREALLTARLPDGQVVANHPTFNKAILEVAKSINPSGVMLPNASGTGLSNAESRIAEIEGKYMRAPHGSDLWKSYWTGDSGARMQQEYRGLLATREQARHGRAR